MNNCNSEDNKFFNNKTCDVNFSELGSEVSISESLYQNVLKDLSLCMRDFLDYNNGILSRAYIDNMKEFNSDYKDFCEGSVLPDEKDKLLSDYNKKILKQIMFNHFYISYLRLIIIMLVIKMIY